MPTVKDSVILMAKPKAIPKGFRLGWHWVKHLDSHLQMGLGWATRRGLRSDSQMEMHSDFEMGKQKVIQMRILMAPHTSPSCIYGLFGQPPQMSLSSGLRQGLSSPMYRMLKFVLLWFLFRKYL